MNTSILRYLALSALMLAGCADSTTGPLAPAELPGAASAPPTGPAPTVAHVGGIAFVSTRHDGDPWIHVVRPDGTGLTRLVSGARPAWSPDGRRLAFEWWNGRDVEIGTIDVAGTDYRRLADRGAYTPQWSPDGTSVVFGRDGEIFLVDADGTDERRLIDRASLTAWTGFGEGVNDSRYMWSPTFSPDGRHLAVAAFGREGGEAVILVLTADGRSRVPGSPVFRATSSATMDWSPDGSRLLFGRSSPTGEPEIVSVGVGAWDERILPMVGDTPRWSPDGTSVLLTTPLPWACTGEPCAARIWVADPVTGQRAQLVADDPRAGRTYTDTDAVWSSSGH